MYEDEFAIRLARLRSEKGVSARDMSLSIGQNAGYINSIESGKSLPSMSAFFFICEYLGITPQEFFDTDTEYPGTIGDVISGLKQLDKNELAAVETIVSRLADKKDKKSVP